MLGPCENYYIFKVVSSYQPFLSCQNFAKLMNWKFDIEVILEVFNVQKWRKQSKNLQIFMLVFECVTEDIEG